ncbi:MAG TPA: acyl-[ACP]--phospholipid O-acyltransferase [Acetobacteraceae bacterium]|jgi:acyl-[acyl-carrier-protein]-phospholipid O-acyltransferase/long-chain-fatty-acid--[acyl-carrier-protein] ligase|nr:acyl-[ACP]--phospholipid O-acyltransferase [Acetobacteraceae bacterium]
MSASPIGLLKTRRLWPLVLAQSCGALNDNLVKNAMVVLAIFQLGIGGAGLSAAAGALFIAPYILLSATAGKLADRFPKPRVVLACKLAEVLLMVASAAAFLTESVPALLAVLAGLGVQAALFGPVKYGLLPEHLAEEELVAGNGVIEATTFLSIVCGTVAGGALVLLAHGTAAVGIAGVALSLLGVFGAARIPASPAAEPSLRITPNLFAETWRVVRHAASVRAIWLSVLGLSWFWTMGATLMTEFPVVARDTLHSDGTVLTLLLSVFAIGVGVGSVQCARLLKGEVSARLVPFAALGISLFCWDFARAAASAGDLANAAVALSSFAGWRMIVDLFLLAVCGGVFSVPLYAIIQDAAAASERSRMIAANNIMNALFMVAGAAAAATMAAMGLDAPAVLFVAAIANLVVALWIVRILPHEVYRGLFRWYFSRFHHVQVRGLENYKAAGDRVVIVANHQSYLDACLIAAYLPDSPTFAIHTAQAAKWYFKPFLAAVETFPVDVQSPYSVKRMVEAVRDHGRKLMIFPEGRMTRTGALMKVYEGAALVADKSHAKVVPISIEGLQFSRLGRMRGRLHLRWFPRLRLNILPPVTLAPSQSEDLTPRQRREVIGRALQDVMVDAVFRSKETGKSLFSALLDARQAHGARTLIAEDIQRAPISFDRVVVGSAALGRALVTAAPGETHLALLMPNAVASLVAFMGLQAFGVVPCMLNVSAGAAAMLSACRAAGVRTVISSRTFVEKARLNRVVERMSEEVRFIWLEEVRETIGLREKLRAKVDAWRPRRLPGAATDPDAPAVVLFTSGSEGTPKGVVLSHRNLLANCAQLASVIDFHGGDIVFNAMPMFHAFGLTGGTILPLVSGVRTFHYPSPLHYRIVPALIYDTDATICFGTDTFLNGWARYAHPYDFYAMRYIFAGAEKVREETRRLFADRFGVRVLEGYGATETAPVLALNTAMHCRPGTVGRFLPGIEWRLEPVAGIDTGGRLFVRGPNAMLGYLRDSAPGVLESLADGWYDTGDIVSVDPAGFVTIVGRAKRFAKIGGEMVSMTAAETLVASLWPHDAHAVISVPDARKGESLLLVTARVGAEVRDILAFARERGVPEIMVPRSVLSVPAVPLLATGKVDYPAVVQLMETARSTQVLESATV